VQADGRVWIDTKINTDGVEKGFDRIRINLKILQCPPKEWVKA